jgi:hypothetical protein
MVKQPDRTGVLKEAGVRFPGYRPSEVRYKACECVYVMDEKVL